MSAAKVRAWVAGEWLDLISISGMGDRDKILFDPDGGRGSLRDQVEEAMAVHGNHSLWLHGREASVFCTPGAVPLIQAIETA